MPYGDTDVCEDCAFGIEGESDVCEECDMGDCYTPAEEDRLREHPLKFSLLSKEAA